MGKGCASANWQANCFHGLEVQSRTLTKLLLSSVEFQPTSQNVDLNHVSQIKNADLDDQP